jgi:hypothetical protein
MQRMTATAGLLALALSSSGGVVAGPPGGVSSRTVLDEVADGLRKYRKATYIEARVEWLEKLAPTHDPRVAVALMAADDEDGAIKSAAVRLLGEHFVRGTRFEHESYYDVGGWWRASGTELSRRAAQLP